MPSQITQNGLEMDEQGMVVTRPVLGWTMVPVAGTAVLLRLQYAETPVELKTGGRFLQVLLTPQQAQELAEMLTTQAQRILTTRPSERPN